MAPKKRTYSNVSESSDDTTNVSSAAAPVPAFAAPATPSAAPQNGSATPRPAPTLPIATPTRPAALPPLTKSQQKRMGMTSFGSESGGPTARGSSYGYEHRLPTDAYPDFLNPAQREEVERQREAESAMPTSTSANAARQPDTTSPGLSYDQASTPTRTQEAARARRLPVLQAPSSQQDSNFSQGGLSAIGHNGNTPLPRPGARHQYAAFRPNPLPRSGLYGHENALQPAQASSPPPWRGSSYASSNVYGGSGAPTQPPSRAAGLAALSNIPGDPAYNPPAVPSIWGSDHWTGNAATGAGDDPFTFPHTTTPNWPGVAEPQQQAGGSGSHYIPQPALQQPWHAQSYQAGSRLPGVQRQGHGDTGFRGATTARTDGVPQHLLRPSNQHNGFEPPFSPTSRTNDSIAERHPSTAPHVPSDLNQEFDWRVSPNPDLDDVVAPASTAVPAHDAHARPDGHQLQAEQGPEMTQTDDSADIQAQQARPFGPTNTGTAPSGYGDMSDVGAATHAQEALAG
ncbi:hypothetical protein CKM354_001082300 [Cercospora kikuchii]|uniref:Uncharacterized protein n=1 Tax=Cercospora kikuchii TaxID=84275 RepID=A0A9P3CRR2_9PEZI|nr:uncharacterized protein CKM354_001082300 [Cercospora kikuchii]GIZ47738.1 hypothetical protein CKM354_001082300 [Cercospora kikuchii]